MEVYHAQFDYVKQRRDVMSFRKGDQFYVIDKPNEEWWKARKLSDNTFGYVPSVYLEKSQERTVGRLIPVPEIRRNTREHDIHLQALAELHQRVKPLPAHVLGHALGVDVPREPAPKPPKGLKAAQQQKRLHQGPDSRLMSPEPPPPVSLEPSSVSHAPRAYTGGSLGPPPPMARSPSPKPNPAKPKSRNGSFRHEEEDDGDFFPPYHHKAPPSSVSSPPPPDYELPDYDVPNYDLPDYDLDDKDASNEIPYHHRLNNSGRFIDLQDLEEEPPSIAPTAPPMSPGGRGNEDDVIRPKPLHNPVKESPVHRNLHRELRTSGRKVLNAENELKKAFRNRTERKTMKAMDEEKNLRRTSLDIKLEERLKIGEQDSMNNLEVLEKAAREPEFMKVQLKSRPGSRKT